MANEEEPGTVPYTDPERDDFRARMEAAVAKFNTRLDHGAARFDALDSRVDSVLERMGHQDEQIAKAVTTSEKTLVETREVREVVLNLRAFGNFCSKIAAGGRWIGAWVHRSAKFLAPIVTVATVLWAAFHAFKTGGKPPNVP